MKLATTLILLFSLSLIYGQDSNIQYYTPSKLMQSGQWDIKWFNNLYTQTKDSEKPEKQPRETYFTSTIDIFIRETCYLYASQWVGIISLGEFFPIYIRSLAPADFSGAVFTCAHFQKIAQISSLCD